MNYRLQHNVRGSVCGWGPLWEPSTNQSKSGQPICYRTGHFYLLLTTDGVQVPVASAVPGGASYSEGRPPDGRPPQSHGESNPEVLRYLEDENAHTAASMAHTEGLQDELFAEMRGRIKEDDASVPVRRGDYWYYTRFVEAGEYPLYCRKKDTPDAAEEVMLDGNAMAAGAL